MFFEHLERMPFVLLASFPTEPLVVSCEWVAGREGCLHAACVLSLIRFKLMVAIYPDLTDGGGGLGSLLAPFFVFGFGDIFLTLEAADGWMVG